MARYGPPPILPPVFGTPPIAPGSLPPFIPMPHVYSMPPPPMELDPSTAPSGDYVSGPFCFGIDKAICQTLPQTIHIGPSSGMLKSAGFDIPVWGICGVLLNVTCGVLMTIILLTILGIAFYGLVQ